MVGPRTDEAFKRDLMESDLDVRTVASWVEARGLPAKRLGLAVRPSVDRADEFNDGGVDLLVGRYHVQVKHRGVAFTCRADFPFTSIIVDAVDQQARLKWPIDYWVLTSRSRESALVVPRESRDWWRVVRRYDPTRERERAFLECPTFLVFDFDQWIEKLRRHVPRLADVRNVQD